VDDDDFLQTAESVSPKWKDNVIAKGSYWQMQLKKKVSERIFPTIFKCFVY